MEFILSIFLGIGLAAAAGFRVFLPLLALSIANHFGLPLGENFEWIGSFPAMITLAIAAFIEIGAYYIPWLDNLLDTVAIPIATIAGTALMFATLTELSPMFTWGLAIIAGGGTAGAISSATAGTRLVSTTSTAGFGNPVVSTVETGSSIILTLLAFVFPVIAFFVVIFIFYLIFKVFKKQRKLKLSVKALAVKS